MPLSELHITEDMLNRPIYLDEISALLGEKIDLNPASDNTAITLTRMACALEEYGQNSEYPVGVVAWGIDEEDRPFILPTVNTIPHEIKKHLIEDNEPEDIRIPKSETIAGSHMSVHGEFMMLLNLPANFKELYVTASKELCATCNEALCELGNSPHHKGKIEKFYANGGAASDSNDPHHEAALQKTAFSRPMSKIICERAKIGYQLINARAGKMAEVVAPFVPRDKRGAAIENPVIIQELESITSFDQINEKAVLSATKKHAQASSVPNNQEAATLILHNPDNGKFYTVTASASYPPGFEAANADKYRQYDETTKKTSYLYLMDAMKRAKIGAIDAGLSTDGAKAVIIKFPTSGMLVNGVQYGITEYITDNEINADEILDLRKQDRFAVFFDFLDKGIISRRAATAPKPQPHNALTGHNAGEPQWPETA